MLKSLTVAELVANYPKASPYEVKLAKALEDECGREWWLEFGDQEQSLREIARNPQRRDSTLLEAGLRALSVATRAIRAAVAAGEVSLSK